MSTPVDWEPVEWIPGLHDIGLPPYFVADSTGRVHVFNTQRLGGRFVIMYSYWTVGVGWSQPIDIIAAGAEQTRISGAFIDNSGMVNIIYWGGDETQADIYYSRANVNEAMHSTSWSTPILIGYDAINPATAAFIGDQEGNLLVVYSGNIQGNGLYSVRSDDSGDSWTTPDLVYSTRSDQLWPTALKMIISEDETTHAVWALGDDTGNSRRVYYASFRFNEMSWSIPTVLAEAVEYEVDTPSIVEHDEKLIVIYHDGSPTTRYMQYSEDNGESWSSAVRLFELVGSNGPAALVVDNSNTLHMFFGNRTELSLTHGVWHSTWSDGGWSIPMAIVSGPQIIAGPNGEEGFDPSFIQAMVIQGNLILLVWRQDPIAGPTHIWFTYQYLDVPALPTQAIQPLEIEITSTSIPESSLEMIELTEENFNDNPNETAMPVSQLLALSIAPALILTCVFLYLRKNQQK